MIRLKDDITEYAEIKYAPNGQHYRSISSLKVREIAHRERRTLKEIEIMALRNNIVPERYQRNIGSIGIEGQARLLESKVAIVGVGGLGGFALELLLRLGVGALAVTDEDAFAESNLNRQLLSQIANLAGTKVEFARQRAEAVNPATTMETYCLRATEANLAEMINGSQVVVDGLDDIPARYCVQRVAQRRGIPFVHGAVAGFWGQVMTIFPGDKGLELIYGPEADPQAGDERELGTPCVTPAMVAAVLVAEVIKVLLGWKDVIRNRLYVLNLKNLASGFVDIADSPVAGPC
jgi:molybdopterin/thiamine biosynthesis adenylyltransferase